MTNKIIFFGTFLLPLLLIAVGTSVVPAIGENPSDKEVIKFSHVLHLETTGADCETCHTGAKASISAKDKLIGGHETCESCHSEQIQNSCDYCHIGEPRGIPNSSLDRQIVFSHKFHIEDQKAECSSCHANILKDTDNLVSTFPPMETCNDCHNNALASNACESCHTNLQNLYPLSHTVGNFAREHAKHLGAKANDSDCAACHSDGFCAQCHDGTNLVRLAPGVKTGAIAPRTQGNDKAKVRASEFVHDANYLYTHGIDAKNKLHTCQTCHDNRTFCNDCHSNGTGLRGGVMPLTHTKPGFALAGGFGSGGGTHAQLARRDIERCMSCHNVEEGDFSCVKCHVDPDGIKRTNPKTHAASFMSNIKGAWHDNPAANCYVCHIDPNARPGGNRNQGFCGYCHQ